MKLCVMSSVLLLALVAGCTSDQLAGFQAQRDRMEVIRTATTQTSADLQTEIAKLPANDPVRKALEIRLKQANDILAKTDQAFTVLDAAILAAKTGDNTDLLTKAGGLPVVGPYIGLIAVLIGAGMKIKTEMDQKHAAQDAVTQVVKSVDVAFPNKTPEQKAALEGVQDTSTKALVAQLKAAA